MAELRLRIDLDGETQNKTVADLTSRLLDMNSEWDSRASNPGEWLLSVQGPAEPDWLNDRWAEVRGSARHAHEVRELGHSSNEPLRIDQFDWSFRG